MIMQVQKEDFEHQQIPVASSRDQPLRMPLSDMQEDCANPRCFDFKVDEGFS